MHEKKVEHELGPIHGGSSIELKHPNRDLSVRNPKLNYEAIALSGFNLKGYYLLKRCIFKVYLPKIDILKI